ncbi:hypothetical protein, partial [Streptomyces sp. NPDC047123]|uniref:hypothetical protein n=1 Tax=Streptomyces sp. NPDC047123 TaxID=3155622 RepID=UPI0033C1BD7B
MSVRSADRRSRATSARVVRDLTVRGLSVRDLTVRDLTAQARPVRIRGRGTSAVDRARRAR